MKTRLFHFLLPMAFLVTAHGGTHVWSGAGANTSWNNPANWSSGGVPAAGEAAPVKLVFPGNAANRTSTLNISNLKVDAIEVDLTGGHYTFPTAGIPVTLTGAAGDNFKVTGVLGNVTWQPAITLQATCRVNLGGSANLDIQGVIAGSGGLTKQGSGFLLFTTSGVANSFTGALRVESGNLTLRKLAGTACFGGKLELAAGTCNIERSHQIPDNAAIEITGGILSISSATWAGTLSETVGNITFGGSSAVQANTNCTIILAGTLSTSDLVQATSSITANGNGVISFGSGNKTIFIPRADSHISIDAAFGNGAAATGIVKTGAGSLRLNRANTFSGAVEVKGGTLEVNQATSLGTTAGSTTVREGAVLVIGEPMTLPAGEKIILEGTLESYENAEVPGEVVLGGSPEHQEQLLEGAEDVRRDLGKRLRAGNGSGRIGRVERITCQHLLGDYEVECLGHLGSEQEQRERDARARAIFRRDLESCGEQPDCRFGSGMVFQQRHPQAERILRDGSSCLRNDAGTDPTGQWIADVRGEQFGEPGISRWKFPYHRNGCLFHSQERKRDAHDLPGGGNRERERAHRAACRIRQGTALPLLAGTRLCCGWNARRFRKHRNDHQPGRHPESSPRCNRKE